MVVVAVAVVVGVGVAVVLNLCQKEDCMYYEEKVVNGVLCWRGTPEGEWTPWPLEGLTARVIRIEKQLLLMKVKEVQP